MIFRHRSSSLVHSSRSLPIVRDRVWNVIRHRWVWSRSQLPMKYRNRAVISRGR